MSTCIKHLYNEYEAENIDGLELSTKVEKALEPILRDMQNKDFSLRDALSIITSTASCIVAEKVLRKAIIKRADERLASNKRMITKLKDRVPVSVFYNPNNL